MITKFDSLYAGHVDMTDIGYGGTAVNDRKFDNEHLMTVYSKAEAIAKTLDANGFDTMWMAEHHFQPEGYECIPNLIMLNVHLAHLTKNIKFGCGFNIAPMWHPLRLAEDYATADILTNGRVIFGVGRGYHTREVETFGSNITDQDANREEFEEAVDIIFKAFNNESFSHKGKYYTLPPEVPYRGYDLKEISLVPRPVNLPVECWQPVVSAKPRGLDIMMKYGFKAFIGGGAAIMEEGPIRAYQAAAARAGRELALGEDICIGIHFYIARTREQAIREITPLYEEHAKMFAPLGFMPGLTDDQKAAIAKRGGWDAAGVPTVEDYMKQKSWFAGSPDDLIAYLKELEEKFPGLEYINLSAPIGTPQTKMVELFQQVGEEIMPHFGGGKRQAAAQ